MRRILLVLTGILGLGAILWWTGAGASRTGAASVPEIPIAESASETRDDVPYLAETPAAESFLGTGPLMHDPIVISPCHIVPIQEQDVSSAVEGVFKEVLVDLGQRVQAGDLLGRLDDRQLRAQIELLHIKASSKAAELIAKAQHDDLEAKIGMAGKLRQRDAISEMEFKTYFFQRQRFAHEIEKAREEQATAQKELEKGQVLLDFHEIKSGMAGEVVKIFKRTGEAVKPAEPLFRLANFDRLRIEGLCKLQQADLVRIGMRALVEPEQRGEQMTELAGHTGTVTAIAVSRDGRLLASAGEDRTVLLWNWPSGTRRGLLVHPAEVQALALAAAARDAGEKGNWLLTGCADGQARLWFISDKGSVPKSPVTVLGHEAPVRAVAFSFDGSRCATGSDDRRIGIWETATGRHLFWLEASNVAGENPAPQAPAHNGAVTSLQFTPDNYLVSAGRDNTLKVWKLDADKGELVGAQPGRTGEATQLGVSPDGKQVLFDHGEELRILDRATFASLGLLRSPRQERFRSLAQFSPSGKLILAAGGNGRVQLWKVPASPRQHAFFRQAYANGFHPASLAAVVPSPFGFIGSLSSLNPALPALWSLDGFEVRHFLAPGPALIQCAAFAPDESVLFTGGTDKVIRVWTMPSPRQWQHRLEARIVYVGSQVEPGTDMVRVRAEVDNPRDPAWRLRPGTQAALRLYPETGGER